jgi:hypothetical protein
MLLRPTGRIELEHRAFFVAGSPEAGNLVVATNDGHLSILSAELKVIGSHLLSFKIRCISAHPSDGQIAVVEDRTGSLVVLDTDGVQLHRIPPPQFGDENLNRLYRGYDDCYFDDSGHFLWLVAPSIVDVEIRLFETRTWSLIDKAVAKDPFRNSSCIFTGTGGPDLLTLWMADGQGGQQIYWLKREESRFACIPEPRITNTIPPVFSPSRHEFLVVDNGGAIRKFSFPDIVAVGPAAESNDEDDPFAESLCYLNERHALAGTNQGRIFLLDTVRMTVKEEVTVEGHESRPMSDYYPRMANDLQLCTDISSFCRRGDIICFVCRSDRGTGLAGWKSTLLWLSVGR